MREQSCRAFLLPGKRGAACQRNQNAPAPTPAVQTSRTGSTVRNMQLLPGNGTTCTDAPLTATRSTAGLGNESVTAMQRSIRSVRSVTARDCCVPWRRCIIRNLCPREVHMTRATLFPCASPAMRESMRSAVTAGTITDREGRSKSLPLLRRATGVGCHAQKTEIKRGINPCGTIRKNMEFL